ncbi:hypothetical protein RhiJN_26790 [Ceratobasidium sp. AG-Ba]|nr:hypothetical protein RhiJN_26790 [Ceratobasidium sp. AG-Ba]
MAANEFALLKDALAAEAGLQICKSNGKWTFKRVNKVISGLGPRRNIALKVGPKPAGLPGRGKKYNVQIELAMNDLDYDLVYDNVKAILECTFGIERWKPITGQHEAVLRDVVETIYSVHTEFEPFRKLRNWAPRAFITVILRRKACQHQKKYGNPSQIKARKRRAIEKAGETPPPTDQESVGEEGPVGNQGNERGENGENFKLDVSDSENEDEQATGGRDTTMADALNMRINPNKTGNMATDPDADGDNDDDGGVVDLSQATGEPLVQRPQPSPMRASVPPGTTNTPASPQNDNAHDSLSNDPSVSAPADEAGPTIMAGINPVKAAGLPADIVPGPPVDESNPAPPGTSPPEVSSAPPVAPAAPFATAAKSGGSVVWRGLVITLDMLGRLRELAKSQFNGEAVRVPPMYQDLVDILSIDPDYDPSTEPDPLPESNTTVKRGYSSTRKGGPSSDNTDTPGTTTTSATSARPKVKPKPKQKPVPVPESDPQFKSDTDPERELSHHDDVARDTPENESKPAASRNTGGKQGQGGKVAGKGKATGVHKASGACKAAGASKAPANHTTPGQDESVASVGGDDKKREVVEGEECEGAGSVGASTKTRVRKSAQEKPAVGTRRSARAKA